MEYKILNTEDGSPSMQILTNDKWCEPMHNLKGALSESFYVYYKAIEFSTNKDWPLRFLSIGLGLGYNELMIAAHLLKHPKPTDRPIYIESFEIIDELRSSFLEWLSGKEPQPQFIPLWTAYENICQLISKKMLLNNMAIKAKLLELFLNSQWVLRKKLDQYTTFSRNFSCILYDFYSSKTHPEVWNEKVIQSILNHSADDNCVLASYSATGNLNRALRNNGFILENFPGFSGKRDSTFACKISHVKEKFNGGMISSV